MIKALTLKNFKAFQDTRVRFSNLNLLTGVNGVGKSSIIQSLLLIRQSHIKGILAKKGVLLNGDLFNLGKGTDALNFHSEIAEIFFKVEFLNFRSIEIALQFLPDSDLLPLIKTRSVILKSSLTHSLFTNSFKYLNAERVSPKVSYNVSLFEVEENRSLGIHGEFTSLFLAKYQREFVSVPSLINKKGRANTLIEQVSAWLQDISPGINLISQYYPEIDSANFNYQFEYGEFTTPEFKSTNVGFGITYVLPIITSVLSAKKGDIIIIENPEAHLHPMGQSKLGELFLRAAIGGIQIIIETHSDHVLNGVRVAINEFQKYSSLVNIIFFERDDKSNKHITKVIKPKIDKNGRINQWPEGFFDEWDKNLLKLL